MIECEYPGSSVAIFLHANEMFEVEVEKFQEIHFLDIHVRGYSIKEQFTRLN